MILTSIRLTSSWHFTLPSKGSRPDQNPGSQKFLPRTRRGYNSAVSSCKGDRHNASLLESASSARSSHFKAIQKAKWDHLCSFLATATPQTVWTAKKCAIRRAPPRFPDLPGASTPPKLNQALIDLFFPGSPTGASTTIVLPFTDTHPLYPCRLKVPWQVGPCP